MLEGFFLKGREHCWKRRDGSLRAISPLPTGFLTLKFSKHVKTRDFLGDS